MTDFRSAHARMIRPALRISSVLGLAFGAAKGFAVRP